MKDKNKGAIVLFDFKLKISEDGSICPIILEAGCGFNSNFSGYESSSIASLRKKLNEPKENLLNTDKINIPKFFDLKYGILNEIAKINADNKIILDNSLSKGMNDQHHLHLLTQFIKEINKDNNKENILFLPFLKNGKPTLTKKDILITASLGGKSTNETYSETREALRENKNLQDSNPVAMMGSPLVAAIIRDKFIFSKAFSSNDSKKRFRPTEKLINLFEIQDSEIDKLDNDGPFILKPTQESEGAGVIACKDKEKLKAVINFIKKNNLQKTLGSTLSDAAKAVIHRWIHNKENHFITIMYVDNNKTTIYSQFHNPFIEESYIDKEGVDKLKEIQFSPDRAGVYWISNTGLSEKPFFSAKTKEDDDAIKKFIDIMKSKESLLNTIKESGFKESELFALSHWLFTDLSKNPYTLVQDCVHGKPISCHGNQYDPTGRVVFVLLNRDRGSDREKILKVIAAYWKLPTHPLNSSAASDNQTTISHAGDTEYSFESVSESDYATLKKILENDDFKNILLDNILNQDLETILMDMILNEDKTIASYALFYIKQNDFKFTQEINWNELKEKLDISIYNKFKDYVNLPDKTGRKKRDRKGDNEFSPALFYNSKKESSEKNVDAEPTIAQPSKQQ